MLDLDRLLRFAVEQGASDVHLKVGSRPRLRVDGRLREAPFDTVEPADTERLAARRSCPRRAPSEFADRERVRLHVRHRRARPLPGERVPPARLGGPGAAPGAARDPELRSARPCRTRSPTLADRAARPRARHRASPARARPRRIAAMVDHVNSTARCHIVTIEDPVEVLARRQALDRRPARGGNRHAERGLGARARAAPGPRRDRAGQIRDDADGVGGAPGGGDRSPGASQLCRRSARSTPSTGSSSCSSRTASARRGRRSRRRCAGSSRSGCCRVPVAAAGFPRWRSSW